MTLEVHEMLSKTIYANGKTIKSDSFYFSGQNFITQNNPYAKDKDTGYTATFEFKFVSQYSYCNYKEKFIDSLVKFCAVLIYFFVIWAFIS